jgi:transcriptional regulator with XRE-family HTH domain
VDRPQLAVFLRSRRESLQPEDVGLPRGPRRRTSGLRREEVAALSGVSTDYYSRIEQQRGPNPSEQIVASIARGLHLTLEERDHLFRLAGHETPRRIQRRDHINAGLLRVLDRLEDTPAQIENALGETLKQTRLAVALLGDQTSYTELARSRVYRWFTDPSERTRFPADDHERHGHRLVALLATTHASDGNQSPAGVLIQALLSQSVEFAALWDVHPIEGPYCEQKRILHPEVGAIDLHGQSLLEPDQSQRLMIFTAVPGSDSYEKLQLLNVIGTQRVPQ